MNWWVALPVIVALWYGLLLITEYIRNKRNN